MNTNANMRQIVRKLDRFREVLREKMFTVVGEGEKLRLYQTMERSNTIPAEACFAAVPESKQWGGEGTYAWFKFQYTVPEELDGKTLFLWPKTTFYEATLWVNGAIHSNFAAKFVEGSHGNHYCNRVTACAKMGETIEFAMECYAYHVVPGTQPMTLDPQPSFVYDIASMDICTRDDEIMDFYFDLETLLSLWKTLPENSAHRASVENAFLKAHAYLYYDPNACTQEEFTTGLREAAKIFKTELSLKNGDCAPTVGLIGHSHMDTAWLWPLQETWKKCARTYANQMNLMDEYPEYKFVQSSAYHGEIIRTQYPELFARIQKAVAEGRYEPNGGVWVECDCNLTGGEWMVRQFVWGQRFTRKYFNYTSDCFWLPDTFGYSFAIPQIMKGCDVKYFLTTKMAWNDTNNFPYISFYWQGLDGTKVLTHLNRTHVGPTPENLINFTTGPEGVKEMRPSSDRLFSFGKGDGGGGPEFEMLESARRLGDLQDVPRSEYTTVSDFMQNLEKEIESPSVYADELYLEGHRGTLTNQHEIKRGNRKLENALHELEFALVEDAVAADRAADEEIAVPMVNELLVRQFHDILPGTCIHMVHDETKKVVREATENARGITKALLSKDGEAMRLVNATSFDRSNTFYLNGDHTGIKGAKTQKFINLDGEETTAVYGLSIPAYGAVKLEKAAAVKGDSPFTWKGNVLETPFAIVTFDDDFHMASFIDKSNGRELVNGMPFGTFLFGEDISASWDNWDIDADLEDKLVPTGKLLFKEIVSDGEVELRIRCKWQISSKSTITQDIVFDAASPMVAFDTLMDWQEEHRFLKVAFDTALHTDSVRNEIQFGCIRRGNHRSTDVEKAKFEICNHKYSDLSENTYGIALLNDCKYGMSCENGSMRLSLHKGGILPDTAGDKGLHRCCYAILPHGEAYGAESVVAPAYLFNHPVIVATGEDTASFVKTNKANVVIETVKPCEDKQKAFILRLYEATGDYAKIDLATAFPAKKVTLCNMLEEEKEDISLQGIAFRPFEIKTIKIAY